jgi:hypothetical protein
VYLYLIPQLWQTSFKKATAETSVSASYDFSHIQSRMTQLSQLDFHESSHPLVQLPDLIRMYLGVMGDKTGTLEACEPLEESDSSVKQIEDQGHDSQICAKI